MRTLDELGISPAPWTVKDDKLRLNNCMDGYEGGHVYVKHGHEEIAEVGDGLRYDDANNKRKMMANARMMSAAPELYEALRKTLVALRNRLPSQPTLDELEIVDRAATVLARASGESEAIGDASGKRERKVIKVAMALEEMSK